MIAAIITSQTFRARETQHSGARLSRPCCHQWRCGSVIHSWFSDVFVVVSFNPMRNSIYIYTIIGNHLKYSSNQEFLKIFETSQSWNTSWWTVKLPIDGTGWWHYSDWGHRKIPETSVNFVSDVLSWIEMLRTVTVSRSGPRYLQQTQN